MNNIPICLFQLPFDFYAMAFHCFSYRVNNDTILIAYCILYTIEMEHVYNLSRRARVNERARVNQFEEVEVESV